MIRLGLCTEFEFIPEAAGLGFDYLELPLKQIAALSDEEFDELLHYLSSLNLRVEALNEMLPDDLRVTGPDVYARHQHSYLETALSRAEMLGVEIIAFDAPASRNVPTGFDFPMAWRQLGNFLRILQGHTAGSGIRIAVQPFRKAECNLLNHVSEATALASLLQLSQVGVLGDSVQMALTSEPVDALSRAGNLLWHVHTGNALTRKLPRTGDGEDYGRLLRTLRQSRYSGRVSCISAHPYTLQEAAAALTCMKEALSRLSTL